MSTGNESMADQVGAVEVGDLSVTEEHGIRQKMIFLPGAVF